MNRLLKCHRSAGFTLIELLIVVAIIAILAAIAVPNFLEAQTRSRISRVKSDLRTYSVGLEAYRTDYSNYPLNRVNGQRTCTDLTVITSPVAYLTSVAAADPFVPNKVGATGTAFFFEIGYLYGNYQPTPAGADPKNYKNIMDFYLPTFADCATNGYCMLSWGPDRAQQGAEVFYLLTRHKQADIAYTTIYDPTNGTVSSGDILRLGGEVSGVPQP